MTQALVASYGSSSSKSHQPPSSALQNMQWLIRYARRSGVEFQGLCDPYRVLRYMFSNGAWRVLCRSNKRDFLPILRNRELALDSLVRYCEELAERRFLTAPAAKILEFFVVQRRLYFNQPCHIPQFDDYDLIRVASRAKSVRVSDFAAVSSWADQTSAAITTKHRWTTLVTRARRHWQQHTLQLAQQQQEPWYFFCREVAWRSYQIKPITKPSELLQEGWEQGNCLYKLRFECEALRPSRFFSIRWAGRGVATLELAWRSPEKKDTGMNRVLGTWVLQDLRKSYNRLPDKYLLACMQDFARQYDSWTQRPGRMPQGHLDEMRNRIQRVNRKSDGSGWYESIFTTT
jgi:hypothetical protein